MTPFRSYSHYVAYGSTDQTTFRDLRDRYTGLVVPATIAAYQRKGTGGFVLTLSATNEAPPYMIDPRFPLFQQPLTSPKKSQGSPVGWRATPNLAGRGGPPPTPASFPDERVARIARKWVEFNTSYGSANNESFSKYAKRLREPVTL